MQDMKKFGVRCGGGFLQGWGTFFNRKTFILPGVLMLLVAGLLSGLSPTYGAPTDINTAKHEGQRKDVDTGMLGEYTTGNVKAYCEGESINFRFALHTTSEEEKSGKLEVRFSVEDAACRFFDGSFNLGTWDRSADALEVISGPDVWSVRKDGDPVMDGDEWVQTLLISKGAGSLASGEKQFEVIVYYYLTLEQDIGTCHGASQHSRLDTPSDAGDVQNTGAMNVPVPANNAVALPDISVNKHIDRDGDGTFESTAEAGEYAFTLDGVTTLHTDASGEAVFLNVTDGAHTITESQVDFALGTYDFDHGNGTNCSFAGDTATTTVQKGSSSTVRHAICNFYNENTPPVANDDSYTTQEDTPLVVPAPGVLGNDIDRDPLTAVEVSAPAHGSLVLSSDGSFEYTPDVGFCGQDTFTYRANDGVADSNIATVTITVNCANDPPVANDDSEVTDEDTPVDIDVTANDTDVDGSIDPITVVIVQQPGHGSVSVDPVTGDVTYTPDSDWCGTDTFKYTVDDNEGATSNEATVTISVSCKYTLTVNIVGDGTVTKDPDQATYHYGDVVGLDPSPSAGWEFTGWSGDLSGSADPESITMDGNKSVTATFVELPRASFGSCYSIEHDRFHITIHNTGGPGYIGYDIYGKATIRDLGYFETGEVRTVLETQEGTLRKFVRVQETDTWQQQGGTHTLDKAGHIAHGYLCNFPPVANDDAATTDENTPVDIAVLSNDSDPENDPLTITGFTQPVNGTVIDNGDGTLAYTPAAGFCGDDTFTYTVSDGGLADTATVSVTVNCVNDPPVAEDDSYGTDEDTKLTVPGPGVLGNDTDVDGDSLEAVLVSGPVNGTLALNADGSFEYTPNENFCGQDWFTYKANDGAADSDVATVIITVNCVNDPPIANDDSYSTDEDTTLNGTTVLVNDSDPDGDSLTVNTTPVDDVDHGTLALNTDGTFTYDPDPDFNGTDTFVYEISDGHGGTDTATVTITVNPVNDPPIANNDSASTDEDTAVEIDVTGNDTDVDGAIDPATVAITQNPANGSVAVNPVTGVVTYTPDSDWCGTDTFEYTVDDEDGATSNQATVTITVDCVNDRPVAVNDSFTVAEGGTFDTDTGGDLLGSGFASVLSNDTDPEGDPLTAIKLTSPSHGTLTFNSDGTFTYIHDGSETTSDSFTYKANDGTDDSNVATVNITITPVNNPPMANDDSYSTDEDTTLNGTTVLVNDSDPDGDSLTVNTTPVDDVDHGTLALNADGTFTYDPDPDFNGTDTFVYEISDGHGGMDTATVTITVDPVNDPPVAWDDVYVISGSGVFVIAGSGVLGNDTDTEGDALNATLVNPPSNGTVLLRQDGSFDYTPNAGFCCGEDSFTYKANDGENDSNVATVTVTVTDNEAPTIICPPDIQVCADVDVSPGEATVVDNCDPNPIVGGTRSDGKALHDPYPIGETTITWKATDSCGNTSTCVQKITLLQPPDCTIMLDPDAADGAVFAATTHHTASVEEPNVVPTSYSWSITNGEITGPADTSSITWNAGTTSPVIIEVTVVYGHGCQNTCWTTIDVIIIPADLKVTKSANLDSVLAGEDLTYTIFVENLGPFDAQNVVVTDVIPDHTRFVGSSDSTYDEQKGLWSVGTLPVGESATLTLIVEVDPCCYTGSLKNMVSVAASNPDPNPENNEAIEETGVLLYQDDACTCRVIISEIAWAGTSADPQDEWIELRNLSPYPINLEGWTLRWRHKHPETPEQSLWEEIPLNGVIPPSEVNLCETKEEKTWDYFNITHHGGNPTMTWWELVVDEDALPRYFSLERRHDATVGDIEAGLVYYQLGGIATVGLDLPDEGAVVELLNALGQVVDTANMYPDDQLGWVAGDATDHASMERIDPLGKDTESNWRTNLGVFAFGKDALGRRLLASPAGPNEWPLEWGALPPGVNKVTEVTADTVFEVVLPPPEDATEGGGGGGGGGVGDGWPRVIAAVAGESDAQVIAHGVGVVTEGISLTTHGTGYTLTIDTSTLTKGQYRIWVLLEPGHVILVPFEVVD